MIFLRRESFKEYIRYYPVTSTIIALNIVLFGLMEWYGSSADTKTLLAFGALFKTTGLTPEWWRYFTAMFLHIGLQHLLFNLFALYVFAPPLERMLGSWQYAGFYLIAGVAGNAVSQYFTHGPYLSAGASGAIYGIYAAFLFIGVFLPQVLDKDSRQTVKTILITGLVYSLIVPHVNWLAHLGGFIGGFVYLSVLTGRLRRR